MPTYHPALPSHLEAQENYGSVTSDHVPILAVIPVKKLNPLKQIKIVSWNVLENDSFNGFAPPGQSVVGENDVQRAARHDRIVAGLAKMVEEHQPDFIASQEITANSGDGRKVDLYNKIMAKLGDYSSCYDEFSTEKINDNGGCLTLYNTKKFKYDPGQPHECELPQITCCRRKYQLSM